MRPNRPYCCTHEVEQDSAFVVCLVISAACVTLRLLPHLISCSGTELVGRERLETAPSHDDAWSTHRPVSGNNAVGNIGGRCGVHRTFPATAEPNPSCEGSGARKEEEAPDVSAQDVRSPPRLQPSTFAQPAVGTAAAAAVLTAAVAEPDHPGLVVSSLGNEPNRLVGAGALIKQHALGEDGHGTPDGKAKGGGVFCDRVSSQGASATAQAAGALGAEAEHIRVREPSSFGGIPHKVSNRAANIPPLPSGTTGAQHQHHNSQRGLGRGAALDNAIRDNWGSVFVVGGGRRRRRPPVIAVVFCLHWHWKGWGRGRNTALRPSVLSVHTNQPRVIVDQTGGKIITSFVHCCCMCQLECRDAPRLAFHPHCVFPHEPHPRRFEVC